MNFLTKRCPNICRFFVWITVYRGRVHEKRPKDTEETWFPTEEQREQAKSRFKIVFFFWRWSGQSWTNRIFGVVGRDIGFRSPNRDCPDEIGTFGKYDFDIEIYTGSPRVNKGEVQATCRFWVFDGNGLLGHQLIDSRWFEKNPPTESGWKRRSKKPPAYRYFARKWSWRNTVIFH